MKNITFITDEIDVYQPKGAQYWIKNIINLDAWILKHRKK